jgi:hypothetical protein
MASTYTGSGSAAFFKAGLPLITLVAGGAFGASYMMQTRYDLFDRGGKIDHDAALKRLLRDPDSVAATEEREARRKARDFDLEREVQKLQEDKELDNYVNVAIKRPKDEQW